MGFPTSLVDLCFVARTHVDIRRSTSSELVVVLLMRRGKQRKKDFKNAGLGLEDQSFCGDGIFPETWNSLLNCKPVWDWARNDLRAVDSWVLLVGAVWNSDIQMGLISAALGNWFKDVWRRVTTWSSKNHSILGTRKTNLKQQYHRGYSQEKYMYFKLPVHTCFCRHCVAKPQNKDHAPANGEGCWLWRLGGTMKMSLRTQNGNNNWKMREEMKMVSLRSLLYKLCFFTALPLGWSQR